MASRLVSVSKNIFGKAFYSNIWIAISFGLISQVIGYTKYEGYFDLYWIIMKDGYLYFNLYPSFDDLSAVLFIRVFLAVFVYHLVYPHDLFTQSAYKSIGCHFRWCPQRDSNSRPTDYKSVALPAEL